MKLPQPDPTPVLEAIDSACVRMQRLEGVSPIDYAKAAMQELGKIAKAKQAYDAVREIEAMVAAGGVPIQ